MKLIRTIALGAVCFHGIATAQKVVSQYDGATDFAKFKTYKWIIIQGTTSPNTAQNVVGLVNTVLGQKGLVLQSEEIEGKADLLVGFQTSVDQQRQINRFDTSGPWMGEMGQAPASILEVGTLVIDMYDPEQKQLVWRGSATKTLNPGGNPYKNYERLQRAVDKLLKDFPPKNQELFRRQHRDFSTFRFWNGFPANLSAIHPINAPSGNINLYSLTANYRYQAENISGSHFGPYLSGGGGWY